MRTSTKWWIGAALAALATTVLLAQPVTQNQLSGNECWSVGQGPGGQSSFLCINVARSGSANVAGTIAASLTLGTGATAVLATGGRFLVTAQPLAATITLPPSPFPDGNVVAVCNVSGAPWATNVVTLAANANQTLAQAATLTTLGAGTCASEQWNQATLTWYRVQ